MSASGRWDATKDRSSDAGTERDGVCETSRGRNPQVGEDTGLSAPDVARRVLEIGLEPEEHHAGGMRIGAYRLISKIGEGGFGTVWMAEQEEPIQRAVALKVVRSGMDSEEVVRRFESERQALALMDHPNIARVFDAGTTPGGRPFFVMELVRGVSVTRYCDEHLLSTDERLGLFETLCRGVEHAHQKRVIHRDLKPTNVLVIEQDGIAVPKIIDFGIARATGGGPGGNPLITQANSFLGTPAYTSPEQLDPGSVDIDTRSDIYSLGVLLFELVCGTTPFHQALIAHAQFDEMRRAVLEMDAPRPSRCFDSLHESERVNVAASRGTTPARLAAMLRGDVDWIAIRCLEKDRARRYATASGLADDVLRHLRNEPVEARPPGKWYRFTKLVRRNRLVFGATGLVAASLAIGAIAATWQAVRATRAEREQIVLREIAEQARANEAVQRQRAEARELAARRQAYVADMNRIPEALKLNYLARANALLERHRPEPGELDLRGWEWRYLWSQARADEHEVLKNGSTRMGRISLSADGTLLAWDKYSALEAGQPMIVMNRLTRRTVLELPKCYRPAFAPGDARLAYAREGPEGTDELVVTDLATGITTLHGVLPTRFTKWIEFTPDGRSLLAIGAGYVAAWNSRSGEKIWQRELTVPGHAFQLCNISSDGARVACAAPGGRFRILSMLDGSTELAGGATGGQVVALAFSPDGTRILSASGFAESTIQVWDATRGELLDEIEGHRASVTSLRFAGDGSRLLSGASDHSIRVWEWPSCKPVRVLRGHKDVVEGLALIPEGGRLVSHSAEGAILEWAIDQPQAVVAFRRVPVQVAGAGLAAEAGTVVTVGREGVMRWDVSSLTGKLVWRPPLDMQTVSAVVSADGTRVFFLDNLGGVHELDSLTGTLRTNVIQGEQVDAINVTGDGHNLLLFTTRQRGSATESLVKVWNTETSQNTATILVPGEVGVSTRPSFPQRLPFIALHNENRVQIWDVTAPDAPFAVLTLPAAWYQMLNTKVDVSPDRRWAAANHGTGYFAVWDLSRPQQDPVAVIRAFLKGGHSVAFSPDGTRLAVSSGVPEAIKLFEVGTWSELVTLDGEGSNLNRSAFSVDGSTLMAINREGNCYLWSAPTWEQVAEEERGAAGNTKLPEDD